MFRPLLIQLYIPGPRCGVPPFYRPFIQVIAALCPIRLVADRVDVENAILNFTEETR